MDGLEGREEAEVEVVEEATTTVVDDDEGGIMCEESFCSVE